MSTWKTRLFSNTRRNFYGSIVMGLVVCGGSLWYLIRAINLGAGRSFSGLLLMAKSSSCWDFLEPRWVIIVIV
jgi:hypothetical protein